MVIDSSESDFGDNSNGAAVNITSDVKRGKQKVPLPTTEIATNGPENDVKGKKNGNNVVVDEDDEEDSDEEEEELSVSLYLGGSGSMTLTYTSQLYRREHRQS